MPDIPLGPSGGTFRDVPGWCVENNRKFWGQAGVVESGIRDEIRELAQKFELAELEAEGAQYSADAVRQKLSDFAVKSVRDLPAYASEDLEPEEHQARADEAFDYMARGYASDVKALYEDVYAVSQVHEPVGLCERDLRDNSVKYPFSVGMDLRAELDRLARGAKDPDTGKPLESFSQLEQRKLREMLDESLRKHTGKSLAEVSAGFDASRPAKRPEEDVPVYGAHRALPRAGLVADAEPGADEAMKNHGR